MKKIYFLKTCSTCARILKELNLSDDWILREIKSENITQEELEEMNKYSGSYESLFSRKAQKYKMLGLDQNNLSENDYKKLILEEYTFLKRPVILYNQKIFIGNSKSNIEEAIQYINE